MNINFLRLADKINNNIDKDVNRNNSLNPYDLNTEEYRMYESNHRNLLKTMEINKFKKNLNMAIDLALLTKEVMQERGLLTKDNIKQHYFITIRPNTKLIAFHRFFNMIATFVQRNCFISYTLSFEQKGQSLDTLGEGFHCHIIANMRQRSKGEVLRDTISSFNKVCANNCIQVDCIKNESGLNNLNNYLITYESKDNHKIVTKEYDELWRNKLKIKPLYDNITDKIPDFLASISNYVDNFISYKRPEEQGAVSSIAYQVQ